MMILVLIKESGKDDSLFTNKSSSLSNTAGSQAIT